MDKRNKRPIPYDYPPKKPHLDFDDQEYIKWEGTSLSIGDKSWEWSRGEYQDYIYFVIAPEINRMKVGKTRNLRRRILQMFGDCPCYLKVVLVLNVSWHYVSEIEKAIHKHFRHLKHHGEWLDIEDELLKFIKSFSE